MKQKKKPLKKFYQKTPHELLKKAREKETEEKIPSIIEIRPSEELLKKIKEEASEQERALLIRELKQKISEYESMEEERTKFDEAKKDPKKTLALIEEIRVPSLETIKDEPINLEFERKKRVFQ